MLLKHHQKLMPFDELLWRESCFSSVVCDASVFLNADEGLLQKEKERLSTKKFLPLEDSHRWSWKTFLTGRESRLVQDRRRQVLQMPSDLRPKIWFNNTSQSYEYQPRLSLELRSPTLMTSTKLYVDYLDREKDGRPVHVLELLAMQALPLFLPPPDDWYQRIILDSGLADRSLRKMAGNGLNLLVIGQSLLLLLATIAWEPKGPTLNRLKRPRRDRSPSNDSNDSDAELLVHDS